MDSHEIPQDDAFCCSTMYVLTITEERPNVHHSQHSLMNALYVKALHTINLRITSA